MDFEKAWDWVKAAEFPLLSRKWLARGGILVFLGSLAWAVWLSYQASQPKFHEPPVLVPQATPRSSTPGAALDTGNQLSASVRSTTTCGMVKSARNDYNFHDPVHQTTARSLLKQAAKLASSNGVVVDAQQIDASDRLWDKGSPGESLRVLLSAFECGY